MDAWVQFTGVPRGQKMCVNGIGDRWIDANTLARRTVGTSRQNSGLPHLLLARLVRGEKNHLERFLWRFWIGAGAGNADFAGLWPIWTGVKICVLEADVGGGRWPGRRWRKDWLAIPTATAAATASGA